MKSVILYAFIKTYASLVQFENLTSDVSLNKFIACITTRKKLLNICNLYKVEVSYTLVLLVSYSFCACSQMIFCYKFSLSLIF